MKSTFHYPELSSGDMMAIFNSLQIACLTEDDLQNPTSEGLSELYSRLLIYLDLHEEKGQWELEFEALQHIENPDIFEDSRGIMDLYTRVRELIDAVRCPIDFTLKDLLRPTAARTLYFLGSVINFCLHRNAKLELLRPYGEETELLEGQMIDWQNKISELNEEISRFNEERDNEAPVVQDLTAKVKELRQTLSKLTTEQSELRNNYQNLKEELKKIEGDVTGAEFNLLQTVQDNATLRSKIVQCPEVLQSSIKEKKAALEEMKIGETKAKELFKKNTETSALYSKALGKLLKHYKWMESAQQQVSYAKTIEKDYKALKTRLNDDQVLDASLSTKVKELEGKVQQMDEIKRMEEKEMSQASDDANKVLNDVKDEVQARRCNLEAQQKKVESILSEADGISDKTKLVSESMSAKVSQLISKREEVIKQFEQYQRAQEDIICT